MRCSFLSTDSGLKKRVPNHGLTWSSQPADPISSTILELYPHPGEAVMLLVA